MAIRKKYKIKVQGSKDEIWPPADIAIGLAALLAARIGFARRAQQARDPSLRSRWCRPSNHHRSFTDNWAEDLPGSPEPPSVRYSRTRSCGRRLSSNGSRAFSIRNCRSSQFIFAQSHDGVAGILSHQCFDLGRDRIQSSMRSWTLYNGLISNPATGALFGGEFLIRQRVYQRLGRSFT